MSSDTTPPLAKTPRSNVDIRYDKVKKLMKELDDLSDHFDSAILAQDQIPENNITSPSSLSDQNNMTTSNSEPLPVVTINPRWGFIQDKDLYREKEKLLKHIVI